jgi:hypothetical protein
MHTNLIRDALYYTRADSGASNDKAQGVVIGVVTMFMSRQKTTDFYKAFEKVKALLPVGYRVESIPEAWRSEL